MTDSVLPDRMRITSFNELKLDHESWQILTLALGSKMAFRDFRTRFTLSNKDAPVRFGLLVWRRARWGWIFYRSKSWSRRDAESLDSAYLALRKQLFDERQLASEAFYWAAIRDLVEASQTASARNLTSLRSEGADDS